MSITLMADRRITVSRPTAYILSPTTAAPSMSPTAQPGAPAYLEVSVRDGTANTGTITASGVVGGVPDSETITLPGGVTYLGKKLFESVSGFTTTGLADEATPPQVSVTAVNRDRSQVPAYTDVATDWPARHDVGRARWPVLREGSAETEPAFYYVDYNGVWSPKPGDVITDAFDGSQWFVEGRPRLHGASTSPHHWEIPVKLRPGSV